MESNSLDFMRAIGAASAVFVPLIVFYLQKRDKLQKTKYFIDLVKSQDELIKIRDQHASQNGNDIVMMKINSLLSEIEDEINHTVDRERIVSFLLFVFLEVIVLSALIIQWSDYLNKIISGASYESGLFFLEGIFQTTTARLILASMIVSLSVFLTIKSVKKWVDRINRPKLRTTMLVLGFNGVLIVVAIVTSLILAILDPIIPLW
ncbi:MAG TPA: hypothetical protein PLG25_02265 [bacterium]|nr:hypothetical protein [bacterium]HMW32448.1 hypothetical protein [bacterium]HMW37611.1 hypothetical protein [bacterium]HMY35919.1 hypothetical protein [bacterium]HMZ05067.1 hypothetical protein [bacterium]